MNEETTVFLGLKFYFGEGKHMFKKFAKNSVNISGKRTTLNACFHLKQGLITIYSQIISFTANKQTNIMDDNFNNVGCA